MKSLSRQVTLASGVRRRGLSLNRSTDGSSILGTWEAELISTGAGAGGWGKQWGSPWNCSSEGFSFLSKLGRGCQWRVKWRRKCEAVGWE